MHILQADYLFPVSSSPIRHGILVLDDTGTILHIIDPASADSLPDPASIKRYNGFICPGFINSHCHLELSYLKGKLTEKTGITGFIRDLLKMRNSVPREEILQSISTGEQEMVSNGIVGVGDISNSSDTFIQKAKQHVRYHTFIELLDLDESRAEETWKKGTDLQDSLLKSLPTGHSCSLVPHAPYTVSDKLLAMLDSCSYEQNSVITMHNQESEGENELFIGRSGPLLALFRQMGFELNFISKTGFNSLRSTLVKLSKCNKMLLVHNTFTSADDVHWANRYSSVIWWCFCVNANLFIENRVPDLKNFRDQFHRITLGTDSLASNNSLSILDEMKTIFKHCSWLRLEEVLPWATLNGARFFGWDKQLGSLEPGKKPGINVLEDVDIKELSIHEKTSVRKLF